MTFRQFRSMKNAGYDVTRPKELNRQRKRLTLHGLGGAMKRGPFSGTFQEWVLVSFALAAMLAFFAIFGGR